MEITAKRKANQLHFYDEEGKLYKPCKTEQHHKETCDIHNVIKQHASGLFAHVTKAKGSYGIFTEVNEYQVSLNTVRKAEEDFSKIPSDIRARFQNDAGKFFEFVTDPKNESELVKLGLAQGPKMTTEDVIAQAAQAAQAAATEAAANSDTE